MKCWVLQKNQKYAANPIDTGGLYVFVLFE